MKSHPVDKNISNNNSTVNTYKKQKNATNFKGIGSSLMNATGTIMNKIENGGFAASFLINDTLGMNLPRDYDGLYRDRDKETTKFKDLNFKEAGESLIRESLSGPAIVFSPILVFLLTKKFIGKSTFINTGLLKKMGTNFTKTVKNKTSNATVENIKQNFYHNTIKEMIEKTTPSVIGTKVSEDLINKTIKNIEKLDQLETNLKTAKKLSFSDWFANIFRKNKKISEKSNVKKQLQEVKNDIVKDFNDILTSNSNDYEMVNRVKLNDNVYKTADTIDAMRSYAYDITKSNNIANMTEEHAQKFSKKSMTNRVLSTVAATMTTLGATSLVPKIYKMINPVAPAVIGNQPQNQQVMKDSKKENNIQPKTSNIEENKKNISFKGNVLKAFEHNGNQLTPALMCVATLGGCVVPRINTAIKRAPIDENGKKNLIEIPEIIVRDGTSLGVVLCGVPILSKAMIKSYENASGFVLTNRPKKEMSAFGKIVDLINPFSKIQPYENKEIEAIYGQINNKEKLLKFSEFINNNDGSLTKVFKTLKNGKLTFAGTAADFDSIAKLDKKAANAKIIDVIKGFDNEKTLKLMESNEMFKRARGLNSFPKFINNLILVPLILGFMLPKFVYKTTEKNRIKQAEAKQNNNTNNLNMVKTEKNNKNNIKISVKGTAFEKMKKSV